MEFQVITWNWDSNKFYKAIVIRGSLLGIEDELEHLGKNIDQSRKSSYSVEF